MLTILGIFNLPFFVSGPLGYRLRRPSAYRQLAGRATSRSTFSGPAQSSPTVASRKYRKPGRQRATRAARRGAAPLPAQRARQGGAGGVAASPGVLGGTPPAALGAVLHRLTRGGQIPIVCGTKPPRGLRSHRRFTFDSARARLRIGPWSHWCRLLSAARQRQTPPAVASVEAPTKGGLLCQPNVPRASEMSLLRPGRWTPSQGWS